MMAVMDAPTWQAPKGRRREAKQYLSGLQRSPPQGIKGEIDMPRDEAAAILPSEPPRQDCKADAHVGPVTVSGRNLRCSNCGYCWEIASEGPGPK